MRQQRRVTYRMIVEVLDLSVPVSRSYACCDILRTQSSSVWGDCLSSLSSRWCAVPSSSGADVGTSTASSPSDFSGRWLPGSNSTLCARKLGELFRVKRSELTVRVAQVLYASSSSCSMCDWSEWMRSSEAKNDATSGMRRYGTVRYESNSSESCCPRARTLARSSAPKSGSSHMCRISSSVSATEGAVYLEATARDKKRLTGGVGSPRRRGGIVCMVTPDNVTMLNFPSSKLNFNCIPRCEVA
eukprot:4655403-Prymnesium_polylepis.1